MIAPFIFCFYVSVQLLTDEYSLMSPGELEAKGFILPSYEIPGTEFSDAQAKILGRSSKVEYHM